MPLSIDRKFAARCSTALALALVSAPAFAADQAPPAQRSKDAQPADDSVAPGLSEIIVTAQKRSESLQKAAIAVTAVSAETLQRAGVTDAQQLTNLAPSLQIASTYGPAANFYLRGIGNFVVNVSSDPAVIVNLDGVPLGRPTGVQGMFFDLDRIEVLKGPQGTLYGRNATGGAINIITAQPKFDEASGYVDFSYGNYNAIKANAALNVPLGDKTALRISGMMSKRDGTFTDGTGDEDLKAVRVALASQLTDTFKVTLTGDYAHQGGVGPGTTVFGLDFNKRIGLNDPRTGAIFATPGPLGPPLGFSFGANATLPTFSVPNYENNKFYGVRLEAALDTSAGTVSLIPAYREAKLDYRTSGSALDSLSAETDKQTSVELRLVSPSSNRLQYIFGLFYFNETDNSLNSFNYLYDSFLALIRPKTDSYAAYGRLTYSLTPSLRVSGGLRYTIDKRSTDDLNFNMFVTCPVASCEGTPILPTRLTPVLPSEYTGTNGAFLVAFPQPNAGKATFKRATWRAGVEYDAGPHSMLYASVESGYKSGGFFNTPDQNNNTFRPETLIAYTIGSKNRFLDNRLQLNLEAFWWQYSDQQVSHFINVSGVPVFATENIGKSRYRGIELEARAQVMEHTELNTTIQYLDARDTQFLYGSSLPPNTGCTNGPNGPGGAAFFIDCSGFRPPNAPVWTIQGGLQQTIPLGDIGDLIFTADSRYQSAAYTGTSLLPVEYQKGYFTTDLSLEYTTSDKHFSVSAFVRNLEDNSHVGFSQPGNFAIQSVTGTLTLPRTYGAKIGYRF